MSESDQYQPCETSNLKILRTGQSFDEDNQAERLSIQGLLNEYLKQRSLKIVGQLDLCSAPRQKGKP